MCVAALLQACKGPVHTARNPPTRRSLCGPSKARSPARLAGPVPQLCTEGRAHAASRLPASPALTKGAGGPVELLALRRLGPIQGKPPEVLGLLALRRATLTSCVRRACSARRADLPPPECFLKKNHVDRRDGFVLNQRTSRPSKWGRVAPPARPRKRRGRSAPRPSRLWWRCVRGRETEGGTDGLPRPPSLPPSLARPPLQGPAR